MFQQYCQYTPFLLRQILYSIICHYWTHVFGDEAELPSVKKTGPTIDQIIAVLLDDNEDESIFRGNHISHNFHRFYAL